jgi:hypothetical protein
MPSITIVQPTSEATVVVRSDGDRVLVAGDDLATATGWERKPEGLCRDDVCVPVRDPSAVDGPDGTVDLAGVAAALARPLVVDAPAGAAFLGEAAAARATALRTRVAPDFTLPDLDGRLHTLSDHRGSKVFLVAWASW